MRQLGNKLHDGRLNLNYISNYIKCKCSKPTLSNKTFWSNRNILGLYYPR